MPKFSWPAEIAKLCLLFQQGYLLHRNQYAVKSIRNQVADRHPSVKEVPQSLEISLTADIEDLLLQIQNLSPGFFSSELTLNPRLVYYKRTQKSLL